MFRFVLFLCCHVLLQSYTFAQEPSDMFWVSSDCSGKGDQPQMCYPPFTSVIADRPVKSTNTCGEKSRQKYCIHMSTSGMSSRCQYCDARNPSESHFAEYMTDKNPNNWWQSETMADNSRLHFKDSVNLTVDLGTQFHVNYVYLQFRSPRPHAMVIYKRFDDNSEWTPWAYFSSNCYTYFGMQYDRHPTFKQPDEVVCREEYSTLQPLYDGEVIFSVINGRPNYDRFFEDSALQKWSTASQIRIELRKMHTFGDERGAEKDTLLTYYFGIQKFTIGGRCLCHGHGNECRPSPGPGQPDRRVCVCATSHHTTGDNCEQCAMDYRDVPWQPANPENPNPCKACKCNGNSQRCEFDADLYDQTGSGSRCIGCGNNTEGVNCERCQTGYFPDVVYPTVCKPCSCDPIGTVDGKGNCATTGQCTCKPGVGGMRCDRCLDDYFGFSAAGCQPCNCTTLGGFENRAVCDSHSGQCLCKQNVAGKQCDKCKLGHFGLMANDPLGCKPCACSRHSSECQLDTNALAITAGKPGTSVELSTLVDPSKAIINCPSELQPCFACLQGDRQHIRLECNGTSEGFLPCLCNADPNQCQFCPTGWRTPQKDPRSEVCTCPSQYIGNSCEECAVGHRRDPPKGLPTDRCISCTCNDHSTVCDSETGQCECEHNTGGLFCDRCADGYYGNALSPVDSPTACKPCPCPAGANCEQVHWPDRPIEVVCIDCPNNRTGIRCERCSENFYGDPLNGIACKPCDCSNNVDPRAFGNCDSSTGECKKCIFGTTGKHCELCIPGYRRNYKPRNMTSTDLVVGSGSSALTNDLVPARGCSPCYCHSVGTLASYGADGIGVCNPESGQCPCKPGVGELRCEKCYAGFYGFNTGQGCKPCDCDSLGASGEACDDRTGRCECRPFVTGRQCDQCMSGFFNLTTSQGCHDCKCHMFGAKNRQCDSLGRCECKPFAMGEKCDRCEENHYDLEAGCLPCPVCYNLIQARVIKLRGMLESVFGPTMRPDGGNKGPMSPDDKDLFAEVKKLNETIVSLYRDVLRIGARSSVIDPAQLESTVKSLARLVERVEKDAEFIKNQPYNCSLTKLDDEILKLEQEITEKLPSFLNGEVTKTLEELRESAKSYKTDETLTNEANKVAELAKGLTTDSEHLQRSIKDVSHLKGNVTTKVSESAAAVKESKSLVTENMAKSEAIMKQNIKLTEKIDAINEHLQKTSNQVYQTKTTIDQLPDLQEEVRTLESVMTRWEKAKNTSIKLEGRLNQSTTELQTTLDRLRQINGQLRDSLSQGHARAKQLEPQFDLLQSLLVRVEEAKNTSWHAVVNARSKAEQLKNFEEHIAETKSLVPEAIADKEDLEKRLTEVESNVKDLRNQAKRELDSANRLKNRTIELKTEMETLDKTILQVMKDRESNETRLREMRSRHDVEIVHEVSKATEAVEKVDGQAKQVVETVNEDQLHVQQMSDDAVGMLERMKKMKDQLTESSTPGSGTTVNGVDAATRFARLKQALLDTHLPDRLAKLRTLNASRTIEMDYLRSELDEFKAHNEHLRAVVELLPLRNLNCFYSGKEIEGDVPTYRVARS